MANNDILLITYLQSFNNHSIVQKLGNKKIRRNHKGETDLHIAAIKGDLKRVKQIIANNKHDIDITDFAGWAPIHEASNRGFITIVEQLLKAGSNVNARGYNNDTPLIDASVNGHYQLVDLLLRYGADYTLKNNFNKTAVEVSKSEKVIEIINSFIEEKMRKNGGNKDKDIINTFISKSRSSSPSSCSSPLKPTSPRLTLRFQTIKDTKQSTGVITAVTTGNSQNPSSSTMASTKTYSVSTALDKEKETQIESQNNDKQNNKTITSNGTPSDAVTASSDHNYTSIDSTAASDEVSRGRKRRKSNDLSVSSTSNTSGGPSPRSCSTSSVGSSTQSNSTHKKHHHQHQHHPHHHHLNHSNKSNHNNSKDKGVKKLFCSSDNEVFEASEADKESNLKDTNYSNNTSITSVSTGNNSSEANAPKVPPLRIVLPANACNTTSTMSATTASNGCTHSSVSSTVTSSTSTSTTKFPYVVSSEESFQSESDCVSGSVGSQRITRSSQRVAQQQSQKSSAATNEHHSDSEESALNSLQTDSQHPRKRKIRNNNTNNDNKSNTNVNNINNNSVNNSNASNANHNKEGDNDNDSSSSSCSVNGVAAKDMSPFALPTSNCYQMFLSIRKNVDKKRKEMFLVPPKPPQGFNDYLINRCSYILEGKNSKGDVNSAMKSGQAMPPNTVPPGSRMYDVFCEQEKQRQKLKVQHMIEKQKLVISAEQEILRVHGRAARAMANQSVPFSVCTILKDEEIYNIFDSETEQNDTISNQIKTDKPLSVGSSSLSGNRTRYNGRLFSSWLQDVDDKWEKIKGLMILRHKKESESLLAMQRLEWEWKLKEFGLCDLKINPTIEDKCVPAVHVSDDFELFAVH